MTACLQELDSAGRTLPVMDDGRLTRWWHTLHRHIPGATAAAPTPLSSPREEPAVDVTGCEDPSQARRVINAHLHLLHLGNDTLSVHATALATPGGKGAVLLLGGHGAGKTLVATALALMGWTPMAGDVALMRVGDTTSEVVGGTRAFMVRTAPTGRWFPHFPRPDRDVADLGHLWEESPTLATVPVLAAVWVRVDGDPHLDSAKSESMDSHTAHNLWWTAGAHLLNRVTPVGYDPLRLLEAPALVRHRAALTRTAAERLVPTALWGSPQAIAATITRTHQDRNEGR